MFIHSLANRSNDRKSWNALTWVSWMSENLNFYMGFWVSLCLPQLLFKLYIFSYLSPKSLLSFFGDTAINKEKGTIDKTLKITLSPKYSNRNVDHFENCLFFLLTTLECLLCCDIAKLISFMIKKCKETWVSFLAVSSCSYSRMLRGFFLSCSLIICMLLHQQGQCFLDSRSWSRTSFGKTFLT